MGERFRKTDSCGTAYTRIYELIEHPYDVYDEDLRDDINKARVYAKDKVDEFFKSLKDTSKVAAEGAWDGAYGYIIGGIIATIIFALVRACH